MLQDYLIRGLIQSVYFAFLIFVVFLIFVLVIVFAIGDCLTQLL
jgi:hypothetical protein